MAICKGYTYALVSDSSTTAMDTSAWTQTATKYAALAMKKWVTTNCTKWQYASDYGSTAIKTDPKIHANTTYVLPDGAKLVVDDLGNYKIEDKDEDKDAKVTYKANRLREFSPHLNASDMLSEFIKFVGSLGVNSSEFLNMPIELFINWLVIEAAERDGDAVPTDIIRPQDHEAVRLVIRPKCLACGRFIVKRPIAKKFPFCNVGHAQHYINLKG